MGLDVAAFDGVVSVRQQGNHNPNRRLKANCCLCFDWSIILAAYKRRQQTILYALIEYSAREKRQFLLYLFLYIDSETPFLKS